jgi:hypothetical protein
VLEVFFNPIGITVNGMVGKVAIAFLPPVRNLTQTLIELNFPNGKGPGELCELLVFLGCPTSHGLQIPTRPLIPVLAASVTFQSIISRTAPLRRRFLSGGSSSPGTPYQ